MCEELSAVEALNFLQTEVSLVVDHSDVDEAESFRSLLSYLLARKPSTTSHSRAPSSASRPAESIIDAPPRKRTRPNTPVGSWTNTLDEGEIMRNFALSTSPVTVAEPRDCIHSTSAHALRAEEDFEELKMRDGVTAALSGKKFAQRTEVFEVLLKFIAEEHKQPSKSLLDIIDRDL